MEMPTGRSVSLTPVVSVSVDQRSKWERSGSIDPYPRRCPAVDRASLDYDARHVLPDLYLICGERLPVHAGRVQDVDAEDFSRDATEHSISDSEPKTSHG